jgi:nicotinate-nucleotide adenylyltransferase
MDHSPQEKICLFGGTFDPVHLGHIYIAQAAVKELNLSQVIFLPCRQSPHKIGEQHASGTHRLAMCQLATQNFPWAKIDDFDLTSPPPSYSWRTAQAMQHKYPSAQLYWLMGSDQWDALLNWDQPETLANLVEFIVFSRGTRPKPRQGFRMHAIQGNHPASASAIRHTISGKKTKQWLHPEVNEYIQRHGLYTD